MDRLDAMRIFVTVARLGSFAEAARQLRLSPSVATRSIAQLEDQLGLMLLTRTTRSLRLTDRGEIFLASCQQILSDMDDAERRARGENAEPRGELRIAAPIVFGRLHVLPVVNRILTEHAGLSVRLMLSDRNVNLVDDGIDIAMRIGDLADSSLIAVKLGEVSRILIASPDYLKKRGVPKSLAALSDHDLIAFESIDATNEWRFDTDGKPVRVEPRLIVNNADAAIAAAEAGIGIARTLSYQVRESVLGGRLIPVLQKFAPPASPISAIHSPRRVASANVAAFVKAARDHFRASPVVPVREWRINDTD
jgi:DNA-binding transcriptional LysR family regulator